MATTVEHTYRIARRFCVLLRNDLTVEQLIEVVRRNREESAYQFTKSAAEGYGSRSCASHDFCDANVPMGQAFREVMGRDVDAMNEADAALWADAWDTARDAHFALGLMAPDDGEGAPSGGELREASRAARRARLSALADAWRKYGMVRLTSSDQIVMDARAAEALARALGDL